MKKSPKEPTASDAAPEVRTPRTEHEAPQFREVSEEEVLEALNRITVRGELSKQLLALEVGKAIGISNKSPKEMSPRVGQFGKAKGRLYSVRSDGKGGSIVIRLPDPKAPEAPAQAAA